MGEKRPRDEGIETKEGMRCSGEAWITESLLQISTSLSVRNLYCGLCFTEIVDPVDLHGDNHELKEKEKCFACKECVLQLRELLRGSGESSLECPLCYESINVLLLDRLFQDESSNSSCFHAELEKARNFSCVGTSIEAASTSNTCGACEKVASSMFCLQCGFALCTGCQSTMHSKKCFQHHTLVSLELAARVAPKKCPLHHSHNLDLFCFDCQCAGCVLCCFSGEHKGHDVSPICEAAAKAESIIADAVTAAQKRANDAKVGKEKLLDCVRDFESAVEETQQSVSEGFAKLKKLLETREEELKVYLRDKISPSLQALKQGVETSVALEKQATRGMEKLEALKREEPTVLAHLVQPFQYQLKSMHHLTTQLQNTVEKLLQETRSKLMEEKLIKDIVGCFSMNSLHTEGKDAYERFLKEIQCIGSFSHPNALTEVESRKEEAKESPSLIKVNSALVTSSSPVSPFLLPSSIFSSNKMHSEKYSGFTEDANLKPLYMADTLAPIIPDAPKSDITPSIYSTGRTLLGSTHNVTASSSSLGTLPRVLPLVTPSVATHLSPSDTFVAQDAVANSGSTTMKSSIFSATYLNTLPLQSVKMVGVKEHRSRKEQSGLENVF